MIFDDRLRHLSRRSLLRAGVGLVGTGLASSLCRLGLAQAAPADGTLTVTLLGTGSPRPNLLRFSAATLVQTGMLNMLFDAGRGCTIRLGQIGVPLGSVDPVFITHFHSDHLVGLPDFWMTGYIQTSYAMRRKPLRIIGPQGTKHIAQGMHDAFSADARIRIPDEKTPEVATQIDARDFDADGVVFEAEGVKVTAFAVNHGPLIHPSYGYRIDYAGRSVLISGDTKFDEAVIRNGMGVDLLIHEVCDAP
ncbi:MAG: MBL fold metallo-hydrolase, partial [Gammaproteobacteria bacterium]